MIYALAILGAILIFAFIAKGWHDAYWLGMTRNIEITDSYVEFIRTVTTELEQNDTFWRR